MNTIERELRPTGTLSMKVIRRPRTAVPPRPLSILEIIAFGLPRFGLSREVNLWRLKNIPNLWRGFWKITLARLNRIPHFYSQLALVVIRKDGTWVDYGLASLRVVTTAGVNYIAARMANTTPANISLFNFHGLGTGSTAEAIGDTALVTELTTAYNPDGTRATGAQSNPSGNVYQTLGTNTVDGAAAVTEHGVFTQATVGGTLLDRSVFSVVNLANGDSLQTTYQLTLASGG